MLCLAAKFASVRVCVCYRMHINVLIFDLIAFSVRLRVRDWSLLPAHASYA